MRAASEVTPVPPCPTPNVPARRLKPIDVVAVIEPLAFVERRELVRPVIANDDDVAEPKVFFPEKVLLSTRSVDDAAPVSDVR